MDRAKTPSEQATSADATSRSAAETDTFHRVIGKALKTESFIEKATLLVLTVILSGVVAPFAINRLAALASERQKVVDATKAKDEVILQTQSQLLTDFAETLLTYETLALDVSWYKTPWAANTTLHEKAFARYSERVVDLMSRWRVLSSKAQMLASPAISERMDKFQSHVFEQQDTPLNQLYINKKASPAEWQSQHSKSEKVLIEARQLVAEMMESLGLSRASLSQERSGRD